MAKMWAGSSPRVGPTRGYEVTTSESGPTGHPGEHHEPEQELAPPNETTLAISNAIAPILNAYPELSRELADARERAARAETKVEFLTERLAEMRAQLEGGTAPASPPVPSSPTPWAARPAGPPPPPEWNDAPSAQTEDLEEDQDLANEVVPDIWGDGPVRRLHSTPAHEAPEAPEDSEGAQRLWEPGPPGRAEDDPTPEQPSGSVQTRTEVAPSSTLSEQTESPEPRERRRRRKRGKHRRR